MVSIDFPADRNITLCFRSRPILVGKKSIRLIRPIRLIRLIRTIRPILKKENHEKTQ